MIRKGHCFSVLLYSLLLIVSGCSVRGSESSGADSKVLTLNERQQVASKLDPAFIQAQNKLGLQLHGELAQSASKGHNIVISPYSIFTALTMAYSGGSGTTKQEMARTLGIETLSEEQVNTAGRTLQALLEDADSGVQLSTANSIWFSHGFKMRQDFIQTAQDSFGAEVKPADFRQRKTLKDINRWVNKHTNGKIPSILDQAPDAETRAMLLNAVYYNGAWQRPFDPKDTREGTFTKADGTEQKAQMMSQSGRFEYKQTEAAQAIRLPYGDGRLSMLIVLPRPGRTLEELMEQIRRDPSPWQKRYESTPGDLRLPRFKTQYSGQLGPSLQNLGMEQAFQPAKADFSGMSDSKPLYISSVFHKTMLDVSEKGTEAAAVTGVGLAGSSEPAPQERFEMSVDHPFFFSIEDSQTGLWLFLGTIEGL